MFALLLALRLLGSSGYMPELHHGSLTIVSCPDADLNAPLALGMAHHHHGHAGHDHNICPYAAVGALGVLGSDWTPLLTRLVFATVLVAGRTLLSIELHSGRERPPAIGPPIPA